VTAEGTGRIAVTRVFFMGGQERILFDASAYPALKDFFDRVGKNDSFSITLRKQAGE
jgi:hypothetical protein